MTYQVKCDNCDLREELHKYDAYGRAKEHESQYTSHTVAVVRPREWLVHSVPRDSADFRAGEQ